MTEAIIVALIAAVASIASNILITAMTRHKDSVERAKEAQRMEDRMRSVEKKLDIHNGYAEKLGSIEVSLAVLTTEIKNIKEERG